PVIGPCADVRVGMPWQHLAADDLLANGFGPWTRVFITQYREGRGLAGAVALDAALKKDRGDVFIESDRLSAAGCAPRDKCKSSRQDDGNCDNRAGPKTMMFSMFHNDPFLSEMSLVVNTCQ